MGYTIKQYELDDFVGAVLYLCGVPLSLPIDSGILFSHKHFIQSKFLPNITCISDVLDDNDYTQFAFLWYNTTFAGSKHFFQSHHIAILDEEVIKDYIEIRHGFWGIADSKIFEFAKKYLTNRAFDEPFAIYIPTVDTHSPNGFVDKEYCGEAEDNLGNAIKCSDEVISDFVSWAKTQDFYKNTTIIILGDHLSGLYIPNDDRKIYNAFINASFSKLPEQNLTKHRLLSHFDMTTLILDSLGFDVKTFGLGRNPLYAKTLLEEYGLEDINGQILLDSKMYIDFWR